MSDARVSPPRSWGRSTVSTACPLDCPDSCSLDVTVERGRLLSITGNTRAQSTQGVICGKVRRFDRHVYHDERLHYPAIRSGKKGTGEFARVSWNEALDLVADKMREARDRFGAEAVLPFHYGGSNGLLTNAFEDARFFRRFGASRLARTLCAAPTGAAATAMYGKMAGVAYEDYVHARLIVVWGCNPSATGMHLVSHLNKARKDGAKLVVIDPRRTPLARQADLHLAVRPGTDVVVALAVLGELFRRGWADTDFIDRHTTGVAGLKAAADEWPVDKAALEAGLDPGDLSRFAEWYGTTTPAVVRCGWGQERNRNGGAATMAILALPAVAGKFGGRGGGYTMSNSAAWGLDTEALIGVPQPATRLVNMNLLGRALTELSDPPVSVLFVYNCNPLATVPDQNRIRKGLEREDLFTVVHEQVMTDTARYADLILPATTFLEHYDVARGYGAYHLHLVQPVIDAVGESRSTQDVFGQLSLRLGLSAAGDDGLESVGALLDLVRRLPEPVGTAIVGDAPVPAPFDGRPVQFVDVTPATPDRRVHLFPTDVAPPGELYRYRTDPATEAWPLSLISPASEHTISSTLGQLRPGIVRLKIHPDDAHARAIGEGDSVRVFNDLGEVHCEATLTPEVRSGTVALPKGLWARSTFNGATATALVPDTLTDIAGGACFNDARVNVELLGRH